MDKETTHTAKAEKVSSEPAQQVETTEQLAKRYREEQQDKWLRNLIKKHRYERVEGPNGAIGLRMIKNEEAAVAENDKEISQLEESNDKTEGELANVRESLDIPPQTEEPPSIASNKGRIEQLEKENEKMRDDPTYAFLRSHGFQGNTDISYSLEVLGKEGQTEAKKFGTYKELQDFLKANPDTVANKKALEAGYLPYKIDYSDEVYAWSEALPKDQSEKLLDDWDALGEEMMDMRNFVSEAKTPEASTLEVQPVTEEESAENESKDSKFFRDFAHNPEKYINMFADDKIQEDGSVYSMKEAMKVSSEMFGTIYPDEKKRAERIANIFKRYDAVKAQITKERPGKDPSAYEGYALNTVTEELTDDEKELLSKLTTQRLDFRNGGLSVKPTNALVLGDFMKLMNQLKAEK